MNINNLICPQIYGRRLTHVTKSLHSYTEKPLETIDFSISTVS